MIANAIERRRNEKSMIFLINILRSPLPPKTQWLKDKIQQGCKRGNPPCPDRSGRDDGPRDLSPDQEIQVVGHRADPGEESPSSQPR